MQQYTNNTDRNNEAINDPGQDDLFEALAFFGVSRRDFMQVLERTVEPELMNDEEQANAYAEADFVAPHERFVDLFQWKFPDIDLNGQVLDLGCGPGDVMVRFARRFPGSFITGVEGASAMVNLAKQRIQDEGLIYRLSVVEGLLPGVELPNHDHDYKAIISNSLLHHLHKPEVFWEEIHNHAQPGTVIYVKDLMRPKTVEQAQEFKERYVANEPEVLQEDFYNSLLAAFTIDEIRDQLEAANLGHLTVEAVSDRHLIVYGTY